MSVRLFTIAKTETSATATTPELTAAALRVYAVYDMISQDTSTGTAVTGIPDNVGCSHGYYTWRTATAATTHTISINNTLYYPIQQNTDLDYSELQDHNLYYLTQDEFFILESLRRRIDMVARRFPDMFEKKFTYGELLNFLHQATIELDIHPPATKFWYIFTNVSDEAISSSGQPLNPFLTTTSNGLKVPFEWHSLLVEGALLIALIEQGILEIDVNFQYSDQGVTVQYNNIQPVQSLHQMLVKEWNDKKHLLKMNYFAPKGIGTLDFASGLIGAVTNMLGDVGSSGYPWWARGVGTRV